MCRPLRVVPGLLLLALLAQPALAAWPNNPVYNLALCTQPQSQTQVTVCSDGAAGIIVAWADLRSGGFDIYAQRVAADGTQLWGTDGLPVCTAALDQSAPALAPDGAGGAFVVWQDLRNGIDSDVYAQHLNAAGVAQWAANGARVTGAIYDQVSPAAAADTSHGVYVAWVDWRSGTGISAFAQHLNAAGATTYASDAMLAQDHTSIIVQAVGDQQGGALVLWSGIDVSRVTPSGLAWTTLVSSGTIPVMTTDGAGGAIIAYLNGTLRAQRMANYGSPLWDFSGVALTNATGKKTHLGLACDSTGSAVVAWHDERSAVTGDIYAQRVAHNVVVWNPDGVPVCTAAAVQDNPVVVADGAGGSIVCWQDSRSGDFDIYAQRLDRLGHALWAADGVPVCIAAELQQTPVAVGDGAGGVIAAWPDARNGNSDVYAQWLDAAGVPGGRALAVPDAGNGPQLRLERPAPNPARGDATIGFSLPRAGDIHLDVFDVTGRCVRSLARGWTSAGAHAVHWDGRDARRARVAGGVYFVRLDAGGEALTRRLVSLP